MTVLPAANATDINDVQSNHGPGDADAHDACSDGGDSPGGEVSGAVPRAAVDGHWNAVAAREAEGDEESSKHMHD